MSADAAAAANPATSADPIEGLGGDVSEVLEALGLEPETEHDGSAPAGAQPFAEKPKAEAKTEGKEETEKAEAKPADDEADVAELKAIRQRAAERKRAARAGRAAPAAAAAAPPAKPAEKPVEAKPADVPKPRTAEERNVAQVMTDVLAEIAKMTAEDEAAAAAPEAKTQTERDAAAKAQAERTADLKKLRETVEGLGKKLEASEALAAKYGELEAKIQEMTARREIESQIDRTLDANADKYPMLMGRRDAVARVYQLAEKFYQKTGVLPDFRFTAERLERVLSRHETQQNGEGREKTPAKPAGQETKAAPRKTVSSSLETPPSFRQSPDKRTKEQVEKDLYASLGLPDE